MGKKLLDFGDLDHIFKVTPAFECQILTKIHVKKELVCNLSHEPNDGYSPNFVYCIIGIIKIIG